MIKIEEDVLLAAIAYEDAWTRYAHQTRPVEGGDRTPPTPEMVIHKAESHQALLDAVRTYREAFND